jgi:trk system potassium uptake protein TrkH
MLGIMFILETAFLLITLGVSFVYKEDDFIPLLQSSGIMLVTGVICYLVGFRANERNTGIRESMLVVTFTWGLLSLLGMMPFYLSGYIDNVTDAYFETMSGYTTTGATILKDIEALPHGLLFWRSLTQWQGGLGIIVFTVALMPLMGGVQLFNAETPGITHERFRPRVTQVAKRLWGVYFFLTVVVFFFLWAGPMDFFDSVNHALTCIATGGYSTKNASIGYWNSAYVEYVLIFFMFVGATNMTLIYFCFNGNPSKLFKDEEFKWYFWIVVIIALVSTLWILNLGIVSDAETGFREALFQVVTLITTTGYGTIDYISWGPFFWMIVLFLMFVCGCAGSTSGGLKVARYVILMKNLGNEFKKQTHPHAVIPVRMDGHVVSGEIVHKVLAFAFAYLGLIAVGCVLLTLDGVEFTDSLGACVSAIGNVGPGLGGLGPAGNFADLPSFCKWVLSFLMLVGRLEIFTVLTLFSRSFWKQ